MAFWLYINLKPLIFLSFCGDVDNILDSDVGYQQVDAMVPVIFRLTV